MNKDVIVACDFGTPQMALDFLDRFTEEKPFVKIGMELFYAGGPDIVKRLRDRGHKIFLDLKLHDIPNTVRKAMRVLSALDVDMVNVHAGGGIEMMRAGLEGLEEGRNGGGIEMMRAGLEGLEEGRNGGERPLIIAVTQLTSTSQDTLNRQLLVAGSINDAITHYARNAREAGLDGVVCSPLESAMVKDACGSGFLTVTPGIRYPDAAKDDQSRITTPARAREIGSDFIVVGRPITAAPDPVAAYRRVFSDFVGEC